MKSLRTAPAAAVSADELCAEHAFSAVGFSDLPAPFDFLLHSIPLQRVDNCLVAVFDVELRNFTLIDLLLFGKEIRCKTLLKERRTPGISRFAECF